MALKPEIVAAPVNLKINVSEAELSNLIGAINPLVDMPEGKSLADVSRLGLTVLPRPLPDGTVAIINATLK